MSDVVVWWILTAFVVVSSIFRALIIRSLERSMTASFLAEDSKIDKLLMAMTMPVLITWYVSVGVLLLWGLYSGVGSFVDWMRSASSAPFYLTGLVGFVLLFFSVRTKNVILGTLGAGLVAAAFSHWVGPITFPK